MKVVSQLKRTLSTVLAMMMIFTSIPQMAMPVLADEILGSEEPASISFNVVKADDEYTQDAKVEVTVSENTVSLNGIVPEEFTVSANQVVTVKVTADDLKAAKTSLNEEEIHAVDGVAEIIIEAVPALDSTKVVVTAIKTEEHVHKYVYSDKKNGTHDAKCACGDEFNEPCEYGANGRCVKCSGEKYVDPASLVLTYSASRYFVPDVAKDYSIKAPTATVNGKKVKVNFDRLKLVSFNGFNTMDDVEFNRTTGALKIKKNNFKKLENEEAYAKFEVTAKVVGNESVSANATILVTAKDNTLIDVKGIALVKDNGDGTFTAISANKLDKNNKPKKVPSYDGIIADESEYRVVVLTVSENATYTAADFADAKNFTFSTSNKNAVAPIKDSAGYVKILQGSKKATITVKPNDGSKWKGDKFEINTAWKPLKLEEMQLQVADGDITSVSLSENASKVKKKGNAVVKDDDGNIVYSKKVYTATISGDYVATQTYGKTFYISGNDTKGYTFKVNYKGGSLLNNELLFKLAKNKATGKMEAQDITVTINNDEYVFVEGKKTKVPTTVIFTIKSTNANVAEAKKDIVVPGKISTVSKNEVFDFISSNDQKLRLELTKDLAVASAGAAKIRVTIDPTSAAKDKKGVYKTLEKAIGAEQIITVSENKADLVFAANTAVTKGSYKVYVQALKEDGTAVSAPKLITISVKAGKVTKASYALKTKTASISVNAVSGNKLVLKASKVPTPSIDGKSVSINGVSNAYFSKTKEVNNFLGNFNVSLDDNKNIVIEQNKSYSEIADKDLIGFVTIEYVTATDMFGNVISTKTEVIQITLKKDKPKK